MTRIWLVLAVATIAAASGCAQGPDVGCVGGLDAEKCFAQCSKFKSCSECAAQPACGFCAAAPGTEGSCIPALKGEDRRDQRPESRCGAAWFYRTADYSAPPGAPYCPPIPVPASASEANSSGGES